MVGCWFDIIEGSIKAEDCVLDFGDNSSAVGWLFNSNFVEEHHSFHAQVAEKNAMLLMEAKATLYPQHWKGEWNVIADSLSRDHHISNEYSTNLFKLLFPEQIPKNFTIKPLPPKLISWMNCLLLEQPEKKPEHPPQMPSSNGRGFYGNNFLSKLNSTATSFSIAFQKPTESVSSEHLSKQSETESFPDRVRKSSQAARAKRPWTKWLRSSGQKIGATLAMVNPIKKTIA